MELVELGMKSVSEFSQENCTDLPKVASDVLIVDLY